MKTILTLLTCLGLSAAFAAEPSVGAPLPALGSLLPGATLPKTAGKVVLVDFWASWCAPCKASFPTMERLHRDYAAKGLVVVGVGVDEDAKDFQGFAAKNPVGFSLVHDASHQAVAFFNPATMPTSYLVDRSGKIRHIHKGFKGAKTEAEYRREIETLLAE